MACAATYVGLTSKFLCPQHQVAAVNVEFGVFTVKKPPNEMFYLVEGSLVTSPGVRL